MCACLKQVLGLMSHHFARCIALYLVSVVSPKRKNPHYRKRKVTNETKPGSSRIEGARLGTGYVGKQEKASLKGIRIFLEPQVVINTVDCFAYIVIQ